MALKKTLMVAGLMIYFAVNFLWLVHITEDNQLHPYQGVAYDVNGVAIGPR
jgi:cytochrome b subunit of formate dehydrogenase